MNSKTLAFFFMLLSAIASAQTAEGPQMADALRENGKINVVIGVILVIFISIVVFLVILERKLKRIENKFDEKLK